MVGVSDRTRDGRCFCSTHCTRRGLPDRGITPLLAMRNIAHGSGLGRWRWVVERTFAWLNQFRRLRARYEKRADTHEAFLTLGCILICWRLLARQGGSLP
jgi:transposase